MLKKMDRYEITMALVAAGCDLRKLDPAVIDIIENVGKELDKPVHKSPLNIYSEIASVASKYGADRTGYSMSLSYSLDTRDKLVDAAIKKRDSEIKMYFRYLKNDGSDVYQKLASLIAEL